MVSRGDEVRARWPLHYFVFVGDRAGLEREIKSPGLSSEGLEAQDPRGNTPLMLAVLLGETQLVRLLLRSGARANVTNRSGWSALHEATARANPDMVSDLLSHRDHQLSEEQKQLVPRLLSSLGSTADFYVEMKWEFTSWLPFVSRVCPSDTYKVWKSGKSLRVDSTLTGFDNMSWERGHISIIFSQEGSSVKTIQVDHESQTAYVDEISLQGPQNGHSEPFPANQREVARRLNTPLSSTLLKTDDIEFMRNRQGIIFRSDKTDVVNGLEAQVYSVSGVTLVTRQRTEHLPERVKKQLKSSFNPLQNLLGLMGQQPDLSALDQELDASGQEPADGEYAPLHSNVKPTLGEYFYPEVDRNGQPKEVSVGSVPEVSEKVQKFKGTVWLADEFPLSVEEHVLPVIELMSLNLPHFSKLKEFLAMKIPSGFPVKLELPLYHVMVARVTFQNFNGSDGSVPVPYISVEFPSVEPRGYRGAEDGVEMGELRQRRGDRVEQEGSEDVPLIGMEQATPQLNRGMPRCVIDPICFGVPAGYRGSKHEMLASTMGGYQDDDEAMLQMAIKQSLAESGQSGMRDYSESYQGYLNNFVDLDNDQLQQALQESLSYSQQHQHSAPPPLQGPFAPTTAPSTNTYIPTATPSLTAPLNAYRMAGLSEEEQIQLAIQMSKSGEDPLPPTHTHPSHPPPPPSAEDDELERVLKLSLTDK